MANPPPLYPFWNDSPTSLLRKIVINTAMIASNGGSGASLPAQGGHAGEFLTTDGATLSWAPASGNTYATATNNAGNTTVTPTQANYALGLTVGGVARTSLLILDITGRAAGDRIRLDITLPATAAIVLEVRNATAGGTQLLPTELFAANQFTTDGVVLSATWDFVYTGAAWKYEMSSIPA